MKKAMVIETLLPNLSERMPKRKPPMPRPITKQVLNRGIHAVFELSQNKENSVTKDDFIAKEASSTTKVESEGQVVVEELRKEQSPFSVELIGL